MGITKQCKNLKIIVKGDYSLQVEGKLEKIADQINIEATESDLILASNKKVVGRGNIKSG